MDKNKSLLIASAIFGIIALLHLLRSVFGWEAAIGGFGIPLYFSYIAVVAAGYLSWHMHKTGTMR